MTEGQPVVVLCPGQGAQHVGMGRAWAEAATAARDTFAEADQILEESFDRPLSRICFEGPADTLNRTDFSQPAIFTCSVAAYRALRVQDCGWEIQALAGLSLGEYTALHIAGVFDFATGLRLVSRRGELMQKAAEETDGGMVALIGADEAQAEEICANAAGDWVLVCANFNAPGQIILSGQTDACRRAAEVATEMGLRATPLQVAGAFHSPLMHFAADGLAEALHEVDFSPPTVETWANVTAEPHDPEDMELLKQRLVEQVLGPVRWDQSCKGLVSKYSGPKMGGSGAAFYELAPGSVLRGLMRRIDRSTKVQSYDEP